MTRDRSDPPSLDRVRPAMIAGLAVSLFAHAAVMWLIGRAPIAAAGSEPLELATPPSDRTPEDEDTPIRLGMDIPHNASIAWLGVLENPVEAEAPESETDQAALAPVVGAQPATPADPSPPTDPADTVPEQPPAEPVLTPPEEVPTESPADPQPQPEPQPVPDPEPVSVPQPEPAEPTKLPPDARPQPFPIETAPGEAALPPVSEPADPALPEAPESEPEATATSQIMGPPVPPSDRSQTQVPPVQQSPARPPSTPGAPGVQDQRAADAAKRRTAKDLRTDLLGQPLQASGDLNFKTVRPTWSLQVRNAYNPQRNPVVEIHFGPDGRVALAEFVRQPDGTRGSGYDEVDQPLMNAVYRWTATGKAIDALDKQDTDARVSVVIRFLLTSAPPGD